MTMIIWKEILKDGNSQRWEHRGSKLITYKKAISQGTNRSPAHWKTLRKAAKKGAPMTNPIAQPLKRSATNKPGVVLLKPCFSSRTKVWYTESGIVGIDDTKKTTHANAIE